MGGPVLADAETGDRVRVRREVTRPRFDWGDGVDHDSVGRLTWFSGDRCTVDFPRHPEWNGAAVPLPGCAAEKVFAVRVCVAGAARCMT